MVSDSALKNAPVTPVTKASGRKMTMVEADEPASGVMNALAALSIRCRYAPSPPRRPRMTCSTMTMVSSMIRPTAAAAPPSVMMLRLIPRTLSIRAVAASTDGTITMATRVIFQLRRKRNSTRTARPEPIRMASRTLAAACDTSSP